MIAEALVRAFVIIVTKILIQANPGIPWTLVVLQINIFIFDTPPKPFDKNVIKRPSPVVHADPAACIKK